MRLPYVTHRSLVWLTTLVMLASALGPAFSRWLAVQRLNGLPTLEICVSRPAGPSLIIFKRTSHSPVQPHVLEHCLLCTLQADHTGLPPTLSWEPFSRAVKHDVPTLFLPASLKARVWTATLARAPPLMR